jgi:hypothetical protein
VGSIRTGTRHGTSAPAATAAEDGALAQEHRWLTVVTKAHEAWWQPQTIKGLWTPETQTVDADEAGRLAAVLAKVQPGQHI